MKRISSTILFLTIIFSFSSCQTKDAEDIVDFFPDNILHHDGPQHGHPGWIAGKHEVAVRFSEPSLNAKIGKKLGEIRFWAKEIPESLQITIYEGGDIFAGGNGNVRGEVLYTADLMVNQLTPDSWNTHTLTGQVEIGDGAIVIAIAFESTDLILFVGCDEGPQNQLGALTLYDMSNTWESFGQGLADINWNIRGVLAD